MPQVQSARTAQRIQAAGVQFNFNDWAVDSVTGVKKTFGSTAALADPAGLVAGLQAGTDMVFDGIFIPRGAVITGGELIVETAYAGIGAGATISVGIAGAATALLGATDLDAAVSGSRVALVLTAPLVCNDGQNIRITLAGLTATATAGKVRVRVQYTIDGRAEEVVTS